MITGVMKLIRQDETVSVADMKLKLRHDTYHDVISLQGGGASNETNSTAIQNSYE